MWQKKKKKSLCETTAGGGQSDYNRRENWIQPWKQQGQGRVRTQQHGEKGLQRTCWGSLKMERGRRAINPRRFSVNGFSEFFVKTGLGVRVRRLEWDREESQGGVSGEWIVNSHMGKSPEESGSCSRLKMWWVSSTKRRRMSYAGRKKGGKWSSLLHCSASPFSCYSFPEFSSES